MPTAIFSSFSTEEQDSVKSWPPPSLPSHSWAVAGGMVHPYPNPLELDKPRWQGLGKRPWEPKAIPISASSHLPLQADYCERQTQALRLDLPRAMRSTLMIRMMVGFMGSEALTSISSSVMPMMDSSTIARSSWFHLENRECRRVGQGTASAF